MLGRPIPEEQEHQEHQEHRRKRVRKGTKSCWECKRRKVKCMPTADTSICVGCRDRHTSCHRQEYVDDDPSHIAEDSGLTRRMARVESLLEALMERMADSQPASSTLSAPVTVANSSRPSCASPSSSPGAPAEIDHRHSKLESLRRDLEGMLPCQADLDSLFASSYGWWLIQQHMMPHLPNEDLIDDDADDSLNIELVLKGHPMKTARLLLCTALAIQQLPPGVSALNSAPGEPLRKKMDSLFAFVVQNVLSDDEMIGSIEGVECLALQGLYGVNAGNLRRALLAFRKAITMAQLLGLHRVAYKMSPHMDSKRGKERHLWYQISRGERYLSTILGVPSTTDSAALPFDHDASWLSPEDRYHRQLYYISGLILARNQGDAAHSFSTTQRIDEEFESLTSQMPSDWWDIPPVFLNTCTKEASAQFERVMCQVWHFELVTLLHLPFMLHAATDRRYEYSRISCMDASRNLVKRWIAIRESRTSLLLSKLLDFQAFTAVTTLLLGRLGISASSDEFICERHVDSGLIEMVVQNFERFECGEVGKSFSAQSISVIRMLQKFLHNKEDHGDLRIEIPFFGVIQVSHSDAVQPVEGERLLGANRLRSPSISRIDPRAPPPAAIGFPFPPSLRSSERYWQETSGTDASQGRYTGSDGRGGNTVLQFFDDHFQIPEVLGSQDDPGAEWPLADSDIMFFDSLVNTDLVGSWTL